MSVSHVPVFLKSVMAVFNRTWRAGAGDGDSASSEGEDSDSDSDSGSSDSRRARKKSRGSGRANEVPSASERRREQEQAEFEAAIADRPVLNLFDGTFGRGGHTRAMIEEFPQAKMIAFDWDEEAIAHGEKAFATEIASGRVRLMRANFQEFNEERTNFADVKFDRMLLDLGVSSPQLDQPHRGFSFYNDGPLDMRMDQRLSTTAADLVNRLEEQDLARLFIEYGEVQKPFRVVRAIVNDRVEKKPFDTTKELASLIERVEGWKKKGSHPATQHFMALRLKVNEELDGLAKALPSMIDSLAPGGILAVITFHSLEDRIVKIIFKEHLDKGRLVNKKVIKPDDEEIRQNPRARSAKLRAYLKGPAT